jgi:hypothetical protein
MTDFGKLIAQYAQSAPTLGPAKSFPAEALRTDLKSLIQKAGRYFLVIFILLVILLLACIAVLGQYYNDPAKAVALLAASGISIPFLLRMMLRMWESKVKSEAMLLLATSLNGESLRAVVLTLARGQLSLTSAADSSRRAKAPEPTPPEL